VSTDLRLPIAELAEVVARALDEDLGGDPGRDVTTQATIRRETSTAHVMARADGVIAGVGVWQVVLDDVARRLDLPVPGVALRAADGQQVARGDVLAELIGRTQVLLVAERTGLNVMSRVSGVATHTRLWASAPEGTDAQVLDTRKTTPGLRALEKYAVRAGGARTSGWACTTSPWSRTTTSSPPARSPPRTRQYGSLRRRTRAILPRCRRSPPTVAHRAPVPPLLLPVRNTPSREPGAVGRANSSGRRNGGVDLGDPRARWDATGWVRIRSVQSLIARVAPW